MFKKKTKNKSSKDNKKYIIQDTENIVNMKFTILAIVVIIVFSAVICPITLQNDTYYTIKIGKLLYETKTIDMQDHFSWHENLPYFYPHWLYDLITYLIFSWIGFKGIFFATVILSCLLGVTIYYTNVYISKNRLVSFWLTLGTMYILRAYVAARAQLVTFIFFELEILFIEKFLRTKRIRYGIGLFIIGVIIANIHSAVWPFFFVLTLPYIAEYIFNLDYIKFRFNIKKFYYNHKLKRLNNKNNKIKEKDKKIKAINQRIIDINNNEEKLEERQLKRREKPYKIKMIKENACKFLIIIVLICLISGFITPIKDMPFSYTLRIMQGNTTKNINEHLPLTLINHKVLMFSLITFIAVLIFTDVKIRLKDLFMLSGLTLLMFMTRRQESMYAIFCGGVLATLVSDLFAKYDKDGTIEFERVMTSFLGLCTTMMVLGLVIFVMVRGKVNNKFVNEASYPVSASQYIKDNLDLSEIKLFNEYNYGSYLLYQDIPVFIDSRCDLYTPQFNKTEENPNGRDIFSDYINTTGIGRDYELTFKEYGITHIILYKNSKLSMILSKNPEKYRNIYTDSHFILYEIAKDDEVNQEPLQELWD